MGGIKGAYCLEARKLFIVNGAEIDAQEVVEFLILSGVYLNKVDDEGRTALHYAAKYGQKKTLELLIAYDAQLNIRDYFGKTPLDDVGDYRKIITLPLKSGCKKAIQLDSV